jgi:hypothetical protein
MKKFKLIFFTTLTILFFSISSFAQGDGPHSYLLAPKGVWGVNVKWLNMDQNFIPAGTAFIPGADIHVDVFPTTLFHTFGIGGRFAQAFFMFNPGSATARAKIGPPIGPIPINELNADGFSDGLIGFRLGLMGAPALNVLEFAKAPMKFSLFGEARLWYSGSYESSKLFNLGTNRMTYQFGFPMAIPLNDTRAKAWWLEINPSVMFFADNDDPSRASTADVVEQKPLFLLENHLSHNFSPKFWAGVDLRYQYGGESSADGEPDDNNINILGGGISAGYQLLAPLSINATYGGILVGDKDASSTMFRLGVVFTYVNMKKLTQQTK